MPPQAMLALAAVALAGLIVTGVAIFFYVRAVRSVEPPSRPDTSSSAIATGQATIYSHPDGAQVTINGVPRGVTPLKVSLAIGDHVLELQSEGVSRFVPLTIEANSAVSQYVELSSLGTSASTGRLEVISDPPGAQVSVDGARRGVAPLTFASIAPGSHRVVISDGGSSVTRTVNVVAGATSSVVATLTPTGASAGWVAFGRLPIELQILEDSRLVGTTSTDRLMLPAGRHVLELVNDSFEFQSTITVEVGAGKTMQPAVVIPTGAVSINASPWAEVTLDGRPVGTTPLGNLAVAIGTHEIVWRHPQLGERRQTVAVKAKSPTRVSVDFNR